MRVYYKNYDTGEYFMSKSINEKRNKANKEFIKSKRIQSSKLIVEVNVYNFLSNTPVKGIFVETEYFMETRRELISGIWTYSQNPIHDIKRLGLLPQDEEYKKLEDLFNISYRRFNLSEMKDMIIDLLQHLPNLQSEINKCFFGSYVFPDGLTYTIFKKDNIIEVFPRKIIVFENNIQNILKFEI